MHWAFKRPSQGGGNAPYARDEVPPLLWRAETSCVSGSRDDTRVRTREVNVGLKFEQAKYAPIRWTAWSWRRRRGLQDPVDGDRGAPIEGIASELEAVALHQKGR